MRRSVQISMTNQFTHIADVKVGRVKGNSRIYPQLRLPSQYAELAGKKASIYEISGHDGDINTSGLPYLNPYNTQLKDAVLHHHRFRP